ncbi:TetR/AcrR family transcriptional regulator [Chitinophaga sp. 30R24]|uniref:TetR/AcrR family transcriptional regulator n=1 Tax=Chitinophaga sp. 30R24 TaxID=3248838 RepID=UPI003B91DE40
MNDSREHILLTSLTLFLQKGFKEVTMKEIVDKTGMSKGAFYHYFSSKEQVFAEVINHFFLNMMIIDYGLFSQASLKQFYTDILEKLEKSRLASAKLLASHSNNNISNNYYYLIFDAMRLLPDFKAQHTRQQKEELAAWKRVVLAARKSGEIQTSMTDEQVAKLFIFLSDGANLNLIINDEMNRKKQELKALWDGLYQAIQT